MSSGDISRKRRIIERRRTLPARWARLMDVLFPDDDDAASEHFGMERSTARKWRGGKHAPSGHAVQIAYEDFPEQAGSILGSIR